MVRIHSSIALSSCASILFVLWSAEFLPAQVSSHERTGVERTDPIELSTGFELDISRSDSGEAEGLLLDGDASLELLYARSWHFSTDIPGSALLSLGLQPRARLINAIGDPQLGFGYTWRAGDWRLGGELSYSYPLGVYDDYEAAMKGIYSGSGYHRPGLAFSATRYLDPLVIGLRLKAAVGLARAEYTGSSWKPLLSSLRLSLVEALNAKAAIEADLDQSLNSPTVRNGIPAATGWKYAFVGSAFFILSGDALSFRVGLSKSLSDPAAPASLILSTNYNFRAKK
jgi:hypothetical protein